MSNWLHDLPVGLLPLS